MGTKQHVSCRVDHDTAEAIEEYQRELADYANNSDAIKSLLRAGLAANGYPVAAPDGGHAPSRLAVAGERVGWLFAVIGLAWVGVTLAYPVSVRLPAMGALLASVAAFGLARAAERYEWRPARLVGGGESA